MASALVTLDGVRVTDTSSTLKLCLSSSATIRSDDPVLASLPPSDFLEKIMDRKAWVARGAGCSIAFSVRYDDEPLRGQARREVIEELGHSARDAPLWSHLGLCASLQIDECEDETASQPPNFVINIKHAQLLNGLDTHKYTLIESEHDPRIPPGVLRAHLDRVDVSLNFKYIPKKEASSRKKRKLKQEQDGLLPSQNPESGVDDIKVEEELLFAVSPEVTPEEIGLGNFDLLPEQHVLGSDFPLMLDSPRNRIAGDVDMLGQFDGLHLYPQHPAPAYSSFAPYAPPSPVDRYTIADPYIHDNYASGLDSHPREACDSLENQYFKTEPSSFQDDSQESSQVPPLIFEDWSANSSQASPLKPPTPDILIKAEPRSPRNPFQSSSRVPPLVSEFWGPNSSQMLPRKHAIPDTALNLKIHADPKKDFDLLLMCKLLDFALRSLVGGHQTKPRGSTSEPKLLKPYSEITLSHVAPAIFSPRYLQAMTARAQHLPSLARSITSILKIVQPYPKLQSKIENLGHISSLKLSKAGNGDGEGRDDAAREDGPISRASVSGDIKRLIWNMIQQKLHNPKAGRRLPSNETVKTEQAWTAVENLLAEDDGDEKEGVSEDNAFGQGELLLGFEDDGQLHDDGVDEGEEATENEVFGEDLLLDFEDPGHFQEDGVEERHSYWGGQPETYMENASGADHPEHMSEELAELGLEYENDSEELPRQEHFLNESGGFEEGEPNFFGSSFGSDGQGDGPQQGLYLEDGREVAEDTGDHYFFDPF